MKKTSYYRYFFMLVCVVTMQLAAYSQASEPEQSYVRVYFQDESSAISALQAYEAQSIEISYEKHYIVMLLTQQEKMELSTLNYMVVDYPEYDLHHSRSNISDQREGIPGYPCYLTVEEEYAKADSLAKAFPKLVSIVDIGDSWQKTQGSGGYDLKVVQLTNTDIKADKPRLFICASIHAREYSTAGVCFNFLRYALENYGKDADITWMIDHHELHALLFMNPDGRKHAEKGEMWRKNINSKYCATDAKKMGCDLNRNFDYQWSSSGSATECAEDFRGGSAASEPEMQSVQNYLKKLFSKEQKQGIYLDFHCFGKVLYYDQKWKSIAQKISFFNKYKAHYFREQTRGTSDQYGTNVVGVATFCVELGTAFFQKCEDFEKDIFPAHKNVLLYTFRACRDPLSLSQGPDATGLSLNGNKLSAFICDTNYNGAAQTQNIAAAEYYVSIPPWQSNAKAIAFTASDGQFDAKTEKVEATVNRSEWPVGKTIIYVRGKDEGGNWGPVSAIFSDITSTITPDLQPGTALKTAMTIKQLSQSSVEFSFVCSEPRSITLMIYSLHGKHISTIVNKEVAAGVHSFSWPSKTNQYNNTQTPGLYLYSVSTGNNQRIAQGKFLLR